MKILNTALIAIIIALAVHSAKAQSSGVITYTESMKLNIEVDHAPAGMDLSEMLPTHRTITKQLTFDGAESVYVDSGDRPEDTEISSDDGSIQIKMVESDIENKLYTDLKSGASLEQQGFMGRAFLISQPVEKLKWKITPEKIKYLDYECIKATMTNDEGEEVVAWFAPAIPTKAGPGGYGQLPGAILMLSRGDQDMEIKATNVELKDVGEIKKPKDGKKVTLEEFEKIVDEKTKEMEKEYGGRSIMIRG